MAAVDENTLSMEEIAEAHSTLRQIATGHWTARVLHVATSLGLFDALGRGMSAGDLAQTLSTHPRATEMLLSALASLGFVEKHKDHWVPSAASRLFLAKNSELYQGPLITLYADSWPRWQQLEDALRSGSLGTVNRGFDADFLHSMANSAAVTAPIVASRLDLGRVNRMLDVGCGPATYSITFAKKKPNLQVDALDLEPATQIARGYVTQAGLSDRINLMAGDYTNMSFGEAKYDLVLLSNILPSHSISECKALLANVFNSLTSEGMCVVNDFILKDDKTGPLMSTLFGVNMLVNTAAGATFSGWDLTDMMQTVGYIRMQIVPLDPTPYSLVVGMHP